MTIGMNDGFIIDTRYMPRSTYGYLGSTRSTDCTCWTLVRSALSIKYVDAPAQGGKVKKGSSKREKGIVNDPLLIVDLRSRCVSHFNDSTIADERMQKTVHLGRVHRNAISFKDQPRLHRHGATVDI